MRLRPTDLKMEDFSMKALKLILLAGFAVLPFAAAAHAADVDPPPVAEENDVTSFYLRGDLGWSFLHAVPPIGTKFAHPDVLGPESQTTPFTAPIDGELRIRYSPLRHPRLRQRGRGVQ